MLRVIATVLGKPWGTFRLNCYGGGRLNDVEFFGCACVGSTGKTASTKRCWIHERFMAEIHIGYQFTDGRGREKAMSRETRCEEKVRNLIGPAADGVVIRGVLVQACPAAHNVLVLQFGRNHAGSRVEFVGPVVTELATEPWFLVMRDAQQKAVGRIMEVEGCSKIQSKRNGGVGLGSLRGEAN